MDRAYKRHFLRIKPVEPLYAGLSIRSIGGRPAATRSKLVKVLDISPGGLMFLSDLDLPRYGDIILKFAFISGDNRLTFEGMLVHKSLKGRNFSYGVRFIGENIPKAHILKLFNGMPLCFSGHSVILRF